MHAQVSLIFLTFLVQEVVLPPDSSSVTSSTMLILLAVGNSACVGFHQVMDFPPGVQKQTCS